MTIKKIRTILVALGDPENPPPTVIERAAQLACAFQAQIVLFHAAFEAVLSGRPFFDSRRLAKSRGGLVAERTRQVEQHAAALRRSAIPTEACVVWEEPAHEAIIRAAIRENAGLVIAGPHQYRLDRSPGLMFTDWQLLRLCPRPLLLVRPASTVDTSGVVLASLDPTHTYDKPAALDTKLTQYGAAVAQALGVDLHVVHCVPPGAYALGETGPAATKRMRERMRAKLQEILRDSDATAAGVHVVQGAIESAVPQLASELQAQVLVLGAISRRGLQRFAMGNTAERIINDAPCDLLILKPDNFRLRLGRTHKQAVIMPTAQKKRLAVSG